MNKQSGLGYFVCFLSETADLLSLNQHGSNLT